MSDKYKYVTYPTATSEEMRSPAIEAALAKSIQTIPTILHLEDEISHILDASDEEWPRLFLPL